MHLATNLHLSLQNADSTPSTFHSPHLPVRCDVRRGRQHAEQPVMAVITVWICRVHMTRMAEDTQPGTGRPHLDGNWSRHFQLGQSSA
jgi:hypothetical protein